MLRCMDSYHVKVLMALNQLETKYLKREIAINYLLNNCWLSNKFLLFGAFIIIGLWNWQIDVWKAILKIKIYGTFLCAIQDTLCGGNFHCFHNWNVSNKSRLFFTSFDRVLSCRYPARLFFFFCKLSSNGNLLSVISVKFLLNFFCTYSIVQ